MMKERRGVYTTEVITCMGPVPEGPVREIIKKMTALYEYLFRSKNKSFVKGHTFV